MPLPNRPAHLKPRTPQVCPSCGTSFQKQRARETYCSIHCAIWPRIKKSGPDDCWPWAGGLANGYGAGTFQKKRYRVSRIVLAEKLGRQLADGEQALHHCDNPACCNPNHLFSGTAQDNMTDKTRKGRGSSISPCLKGSKHGRAKLSEEDVVYIWRNRDKGSTLLGLQFGVPKTTIHNIFRRTNWGWLTRTLD